MNWNRKPVKTTGFAVTLAMPLKMNGRIPPEMTGRLNLGTATYISWDMPPEMGDKCQYHLIWVAALPTEPPTSPNCHSTSPGHQLYLWSISNKR